MGVVLGELGTEAEIRAHSMVTFVHRLFTDLGVPLLFHVAHSYAWTLENPKD